MPYQMMDILRFAPYALFMVVVFAVLVSATVFSFRVIRRNAERAETFKLMPSTDKRASSAKIKAN